MRKLCPLCKSPTTRTTTTIEQKPFGERVYVRCVVDACSGCGEKFVDSNELGRIDEVLACYLLASRPDDKDAVSWANKVLSYRRRKAFWQGFWSAPRMWPTWFILVYIAVNVVAVALMLMYR